MSKLMIHHYHGVIRSLNGTKLEQAEIEIPEGKEKETLSDYQFEALRNGLTVGVRIYSDGYIMMLTQHTNFGQR